MKMKKFLKNCPDCNNIKIIGGPSYFSLWVSKSVFSFHFTCDCKSPYGSNYKYTIGLDHYLHNSSILNALSQWNNSVYNANINK